MKKSHLTLSAILLVSILIVGFNVTVKEKTLVKLLKRSGRIVNASQYVLPVLISTVSIGMLIWKLFQPITLSNQL